MVKMRNSHALRPFWAGVLLLTAVSASTQTVKGPASHSLSPKEKSALVQFTRALKDYIAKEHQLPADKLKPTKDVASLEKERAALRQAIRDSRSDAKQGSIFTSDASSAFRKLLSETMNGPRGHEIKASLMHAEPRAPADFQVNQAFPNSDGEPIQSVPPTLLLNLPILPKGLQYCIAGKTLALRDVNANMVIDYLPDALP